MAKQHSLLSRLALCASLLALIVIALGAITRLLDAGLGCPDWPGCYGHLTVPLTHAAQQLAAASYPDTPLVAYKAWAEMIHRYFVGGLSALILGIIILIFTQKAYRQRANVFAAIFLIVLVSYQIMLGQWTVTLKLSPIIVSQHLLAGYLILSTLWVIYRSNLSNTIAFKTKSVSLLTLLGVILLFMQIMLGAWTSTNYAALSCNGFPVCLNDQTMVWNFHEAFSFRWPGDVNYEGGVLSPAARQTIQMLHRFGALIITGYFLLFFGWASMQLKNQPRLLKTLYVLLGLLCVQICLGISNVIFKLPLLTAVSHTLLAALLLLTLITFMLQLRGVGSK